MRKVGDKVYFLSNAKRGIHEGVLVRGASKVDENVFMYLIGGEYYTEDDLEPLVVSKEESKRIAGLAVKQGN